jgi:thymidylate kinase
VTSTLSAQLTAGNLSTLAAVYSQMVSVVTSAYGVPPTITIPRIQAKKESNYLDKVSFETHLKINDAYKNYKNYYNHNSIIINAEEDPFSVYKNMILEFNKYMNMQIKPFTNNEFDKILNEKC